MIMDFAHQTDRLAETNRRIGFAKGQIAEAMGFLQDAGANDARYWAMKALVRAKDMLETGDITL